MATNTIVNGSYITQNLNDYLMESDGSLWLRIVHHAHCDQKLFPTPYSDFMYVDQDRWLDTGILNKVTSWDLMIIQSPTENGQVKKYRWSQSVNPMQATFADVAAANITKNTSSGYSSWTKGGLYFFSTGTPTFFCTNNGTNGYWWGAVGATTNHQGGIPGWEETIVTSGFIDLYVKINNSSFVNIHTPMMSAVDFIEK